MKRVTEYSALLLLIITIGCSSNTESAQEQEVEVVEEPVAVVVTEEPAVCVWDKLSVRNTPGEKGKWVTSLSVGETFKYLGADTLVGKKTYAKIALNDGKEGWTRTDLIVVNAKAAVMINDTDIYSRPDLLTKSEKKFSKMNIVASMNTQDSWNEVKGKRSEGTWVDEGWIKTSNLSFEPVDIATAKFAMKALEIKDEDDKLKALNEILENVDLSSSKFITDIQLIVSDMTTEEEVVEEEYEDVAEEELEETEEDSIQ